MGPREENVEVRAAHHLNLGILIDLLLSGAEFGAAEQGPAVPRWRLATACRLFR